MAGFGTGGVRLSLLRAVAILAIAASSVAATTAFATTASAEPGATVSGTVEVLETDASTMDSTTTVLLRTDNGDAVELPASSATYLRTGDRVTVRGWRSHARLQRSNVRVLASAPQIATTGNQSVYVIRAEWAGPDSTTMQLVTSNFATAGAWFNEVSYGQLSGLTLTTQDHWVHIATPSGCDYGQIYTNAVDGERAATNNAFNPSNYQHVIVYFPGDGDCEWAGLADVAGPEVWFNGALNPYLINHELGHNLGLSHAHAILCYDANGDPAPLTAACDAPIEYGDPADVMGSGGLTHSDGQYVGAHYDAAQKAGLGWLGSHLSSVAPCTTVQLSPYEVASSGSTLGARIAAGTDPATNQSRTYWLEWRKPDLSSFDDGLQEAFYWPPNTTLDLTAGPLLHFTQVDTNLASTWIPAPTIVDANPSTLHPIPDVPDFTTFTGSAILQSEPVMTPEGYTFAAGTVTDGKLPVTISTSKPSAPATPTAVPGSGGVSVSWTAPDCSGTAEISGYDVQYSTNGGNSWTSASSSFHSSPSTTQNIDGLTPGSSYRFRVAAVNAAGTSMYSSPSAAVVPHTTPGSPSNVVAVPGNGRATVSWTAPADNGGSPITGYDMQYSSDGGNNWSSASATFHASSSTTQTVDGLTNGASYVFRVAAINANGTGAYSTASAATVIGAVPGVPTGVTAIPSEGAATVSWHAPTDNGGMPLTGYDVQVSSDGGGTWSIVSAAAQTSTATTLPVSGLTNGTSYVFRVAAINAIGTGAYSTPSTPVTPAVTPQYDTTQLSINRPGAIKAGRRVNLHTTLLDATSSALVGGVPIVLWARPAGGSWRIVSTVVTTADGRGAASVTPRVNTRYRWVFDGDDSHYAASSASPLIKVKQAVTAKITKHSARRFSTVRVYGTVKPKAAGKRVALQRRSHGRWVSVHSGATIQRQVLPNGIRTLSYVITIPTYNRGRSLYRVHRAATSTNASGNSRAISLRIR